LTKLKIEIETLSKEKELAVSKQQKSNNVDDQKLKKELADAKEELNSAKSKAKTLE